MALAAPAGARAAGMDAVTKVKDLGVSASGTLESLWIVYEQHCEGGTPASRGRFEYRAGDTTPLPPWTVTGPASTGPPTTIGGGTPSDEGIATAGASPPAAAAPASSGSPSDAPRSGPDAAALRLVAGKMRGNRFRGSRRADRILASGGNDRVDTGAGADCVDGGTGADVLWGGLGDDLLAGGCGADVLRSGTGDDVLDGRAGRDTFDSGPGRRDLARAVAPGERVRGCERVTRPRRGA